MRLEEAARRWALDELLVQEAYKYNLDQDSSVLAQMEALHRNLLIHRLFELYTESLTIDSAAMYENYESKLEEYTAPYDQIELDYIISPNRDLCVQAQRAFNQNENLQAIIARNDQYSGESVSWVGENELDAQIARSAFSLAPGAVSAPLRLTSGGFIVLKCLQRRQEGTILPFEEVAGTIFDRLFLDKKLEIEKSLKDSLWVAYKPEILISSTNRISDSEGLDE
jgi:parvulin-like peptidyl-prolyl isomerase